MTHLVPALRPVLGTPFRRGSLYRAAGEVPSFHIAPARTQNARDLITGSVLGTYNSASPAWAVGPDGVLFQPAANAPVIEYDPTTLSCLGARIWGVVTNLLLRSEELGNAAWSRSALTVSSDVTTSPKGTQDADKLVESATNAEHITWQPRSAQSETMTLSVFAKASERSRIKLGFSNFASAACGAIFNLNTGAVISTDVANADYTSPAASIFAYPSGWYRCVFTVTKGTANNTNNPFIDVVNNSNQTSYLGDGTSGVFAIGGQLQTGSVVGPYVPTTATTASSTADVWSITGADFNRIWNQGAATIYVDWNLPDINSTSDAHMLFLVDASGLPVVAVRMGFNAGFRRLRYYAQTAAGVFAYIIDGAANNSATGKTAFAFSALNDAVASENGAAVLTDVVGDFTNQTTSRILIGGTGSTFANGYIRELAIFRSRRPNANLQAMTQ